MWMAQQGQTRKDSKREEPECLPNRSKGSRATITLIGNSNSKIWMNSSIRLIRAEIENSKLKSEDRKNHCTNLCLNCSLDFCCSLWY